MSALNKCCLRGSDGCGRVEVGGREGFVVAED